MAHEYDNKQKKLNFLNWVFGQYVLNVDATFMYELDANYTEAELNLSEDSPIVNMYQKIAPIIYQHILSTNYQVNYFILMNSNLPNYMKLKI